MFTVHGKMTRDGPEWGQEDFVLTNPDLADILGRTDLYFEKLYFILDLLDSKFLDFQVPDFRNLAWAGLEPSGPKNADCLL